jgi:UDP-N-acetylmuramoyl-tripeptide--D-alanyl-D-alanine ligase
MIIDDCYNANPISMKASLDVLKDADTRKVAILGDMFELGENEKELHYGVGMYAAEKKIDLVIGIGKLSEEITRGASEGGTEVFQCATKADFFAKANSLICKGDTILVKASHGMEFPEIVEYLKLY